MFLSVLETFAYVCSKCSSFVSRTRAIRFEMCESPRPVRGAQSLHKSDRPGLSTLPQLTTQSSADGSPYATLECIAQAATSSLRFQLLRNVCVIRSLDLPVRALR